MSEHPSRRGEYARGTRSRHIGLIQIRDGRTGAYAECQEAFTGTPNVRKHKRRCYLTAAMLLAGHLDDETLECLLELGSAAIDRPGSEDVVKSIHRLREIGWSFRHDAWTGADQPSD
jgi:hypothetical protein